jgi:hypothetical protein
MELPHPDPARDPAFDPARDPERDPERFDAKTTVLTPFGRDRATAQPRVDLLTRPNDHSPGKKVANWAGK